MKIPINRNLLAGPTRPRNFPVHDIRAMFAADKHRPISSMALEYVKINRPRQSVIERADNTCLFPRGRHAFHVLFNNNHVCGANLGSRTRTHTGGMHTETSRTSIYITNAESHDCDARSEKISRSFREIHAARKCLIARGNCGLAGNFQKS